MNGMKCIVNSKGHRWHLKKKGTQSEMCGNNQKIRQRYVAGSWESHKAEAGDFPCFSPVVTLNKLF